MGESVWRQIAGTATNKCECGSEYGDNVRNQVRIEGVNVRARRHLGLESKVALSPVVFSGLFGLPP